MIAVLFSTSGKIIAKPIAHPIAYMSISMNAFEPSVGEWVSLTAHSLQSAQASVDIGVDAVRDQVVSDN
jgi:hypothetical protein